LNGDCTPLVETNIDFYL